MAGRMKSKDINRRGFYKKFRVSTSVGKSEEGARFAVVSKTGEIVSWHQTMKEALLANKALNDVDKGR